MTNYEKIKQMSVEEYANRNLDYFSCDDCSGRNVQCDGECKRRFIEWLESEVEEDG